MYAGRLMELSTAQDLFSDMRHPYTQALLRSIPSTDMPSHTRLHPIPGRPPDLLNPPDGCAFSARCRHAQPDCIVSKPPLFESSHGHHFACYFPVGTREGADALAANEQAGVTASGLPLDEAQEEFV